MITRRELLAQIRKLAIEEQRALVRKAARGPLTPEEVKLFVDNAQHALMEGIDEARVGFLAAYAELLEEALDKGTLTPAEMACVLVGVAWSVLYGDTIDAQVD